MAFVDQYREDRLRDPRIFDFIKRITARVDPEIEGMGAAFRHAARVNSRRATAALSRAKSCNRRGSPENPLKPEDIEYKFRHVAQFVPLVGETSTRSMQLVGETRHSSQTRRELIAILAAPTASA